LTENSIFLQHGADSNQLDDHNSSAVAGRSGGSAQHDPENVQASGGARKFAIEYVPEPETEAKIETAEPKESNPFSPPRPEKTYLKK